MAKLHSLVSSKSLTWRSFMIARTIIAEFSGDNGLSITGVICPSTFIAGGKPAVMNRSDAPFCFIRRSSACISFAA